MPDMKDKVTNTQDKQKQRGLVQRDICRENPKLQVFFQPRLFSTPTSYL